MDIVVVGVSYKNTPIEVREKLTFTKKKYEKAYPELSSILDESVILSTCNRSEIYGVYSDMPQAIEQIKEFFCLFHGLEKGTLDQYFYVKRNRDCVAHLFQVTAGLDSQVLGEDQILGQVKAAHKRAMEKHMSGRVLNRLFRDSITNGKKVRLETKISQNPTSISYLAIQFLEKKFIDFAQKNVLLIGAGKMNRLALTYLKDMGFARILVANRTYEVAQSFKEVYDKIEVILFDEIEDFLPICDIVISSTAAPHLVLKKDEIKGYKEESIYLDLAVPRDIDPKLAELEGITVVDLDVLERIQSENQEKRRQAGEKARFLIEKSVDEFYQWLQCIPLFPAIKQIESYHQQVLNKEMPELIDRLKNTEDEAKMAAILKKFVKKIYSPPMVRLKQFSALENKEDLTEILEALYGEESV